MAMTATKFRKDLFKILEKVIEGETVEIAYKGSSIRISPRGSTSKLARAKHQNTLLVNPDQIVSSDAKLLAEFEAEWRKDWKKL
jgi:hypothetical protein